MVDILCLIFDLGKLQPAGLLWEFEISGFFSFRIMEVPWVGVLPFGLDENCS